MSRGESRCPSRTLRPALPASRLARAGAHSVLARPHLMAPSHPAGACPNADCASWPGVLPPAPSGSDGRRVRVLAAVSMTEACALDKIGRTSDSSGTKAVHRVRGSAPGRPWLGEPRFHVQRWPASAAGCRCRHRVAARAVRCRRSAWGMTSNSATRLVGRQSPYPPAPAVELPFRWHTLGALGMGGVCAPCVP